LSRFLGRVKLTDVLAAAERSALTGEGASLRGALEGYFGL
jgi:hypothetical protein